MTSNIHGAKVFVSSSASAEDVTAQETEPLTIESDPKAIDTVSEPAPLPPIEPGQETRVSASQEKDEAVLPDIRPTLSSNYVEGKESLQTPEPGDEDDDNAHYTTPFVVAQVMTSVYWPSSWLRW